MCVLKILWLKERHVLHRTHATSVQICTSDTGITTALKLLHKNSKTAAQKSCSSHTDLIPGTWSKGLPQTVNMRNCTVAMSVPCSSLVTVLLPPKIVQILQQKWKYQEIATLYIHLEDLYWDLVAAIQNWMIFFQIVIVKQSAAVAIVMWNVLKLGFEKVYSFDMLWNNVVVTRNGFSF